MTVRGGTLFLITPGGGFVTPGTDGRCHRPPPPFRPPKHPLVTRSAYIVLMDNRNGRKGRFLRGTTKRTVQLYLGNMCFDLFEKRDEIVLIFQRKLTDEQGCHKGESQEVQRNPTADIFAVNNF